MSNALKYLLIDGLKESLKSVTGLEADGYKFWEPLFPLALYCESDRADNAVKNKRSKASRLGDKNYAALLQNLADEWKNADCLTSLSGDELLEPVTPGLVNALNESCSLMRMKNSLPTHADTLNKNIGPVLPELKDLLFLSFERDRVQIVKDVNSGEEEIGSTDGHPISIEIKLKGYLDEYLESFNSHDDEYCNFGLGFFGEDAFKKGFANALAAEFSHETWKELHREFWNSYAWIEGQAKTKTMQSSGEKTGEQSDGELVKERRDLFFDLLCACAMVSLVGPREIRQFVSVYSNAPLAPTVDQSQKDSTKKGVKIKYRLQPVVYMLYNNKYDYYTDDNNPAYIFTSANEVRIGRGGPWLSGDASTVSIILPHGQVSRSHARLKYVGGNWQLEDMQSTNGTLLLKSNNLITTYLHKGERTTSTTIMPGDVLFIAPERKTNQRGGKQAVPITQLDLRAFKFEVVNT